MRIISRYLIHEFLKTFFLSLIAFVSIYLIIDFFEKLDNFLEAETGWRVIMSYFLYQVPLVIQQSLPAAILLGTIITLSLMAKNKELVIIRGNGISLLRLSTPLVLVSLCFTLLLFFMNETILPPLHEKINRIWQIEVEKKPLKTFFRNEKIWYRGKQIIYHIDFYDPHGMSMRGITIYRFSPDFELIERLDAHNAQWAQNRWLFSDGMLQKKEPDGSYEARRFSETTLNLEEGPDDFVHMVRNPEELNIRQLRDYISRLKMEGYDATRYEVDMHAKISFPFVCVIMTLVGVSMALRSERKSGIAIGVGLSVCVAFMYWILFSFSITSGHSGILPPVIAGWLPDLVFLAGGLSLLATIRQ